MSTHRLILDFVQFRTGLGCVRTWDTDTVGSDSESSLTRVSDPSSRGFDGDVSGQGGGGEYRAKNQVGGGERRPNEEYLEIS